jgi:hypothetical protein
MPQETGSRRHTNHEQNGASSKQEAEEAKQELHDHMIPRRVRYFITTRPFMPGKGTSPCVCWVLC